jgi:succinate-semialdehyde dehydrogenase/glutarate-semialdehyde dehydrogenase
MKQIHSINPKNNQILKSFSLNKDADIQQRMQRCANRFFFNQNFTVKQLPERFHKLNSLIQVLQNNKEQYATLITNEMGKPI